MLYRPWGQPLPEEVQIVKVIKEILKALHEIEGPIYCVVAIFTINLLSDVNGSLSKV